MPEVAPPIQSRAKAGLALSGARSTRCWETRRRDDPGVGPVSWVTGEVLGGLSTDSGAQEVAPLHVVNVLIMLNVDPPPLGRGGTEPLAPVTCALLDTARMTDYLRDACASGATMTAAQARLAFEVSASHFGVRPSELALRLGVSRSAATQMIDRMERRGLVERAESDLDGRGVLVELTPRGERECELIRRPLKSFEAEVVAAVGPRAMSAFLEALQSLADRTWLRGEQPGDTRSIAPRFS